MQLTRRSAIKGLGLAGLGTLTRTLYGATNSSAHGKWWRGNLHMHTYWSDGRCFPEEAVDIYKNKLGYDFLALSDHNIFADDKQRWRTVLEKEGRWPPDVTKPFYDHFMASRFGKDAPVRTNDKGETQVRLRTYEEVRQMFEEPGRFMLMPGVEITQKTDGDNIEVHVNYINLPDVVPGVKGGPLSKRLRGAHPTEMIAENVREVKALAEVHKRPWMLMLNHPQWRYMDVKPEDLINNPEVRFFELCNGGSAFPVPEGYHSTTNDHFWDTINAFRTLKGVPLLYGTGTDDTHYYYSVGGRKTGRVGVDFVVVRSRELTPAGVLGAMHEGDFYTSTGAMLHDIEFDAKRRSLHVRVAPQADTTYKITFITTKKNFDQSVRMIESPAVRGHGRRDIPIYSADIGKGVKEVEGLEATCVMAADDLYIRARVESSKECVYKGHFHPKVEVAWTQPYGGA